MPYHGDMNRKIRQFFWYAFLVFAVLEFVAGVVKFGSEQCPSLPMWLDLVFFSLAAINVLYFVAGHVGAMKARLSFGIVIVIVGAICWFEARHTDFDFTAKAEPMLFGTVPVMLLLMWWSVIGAAYLFWHRVLPLYDARVVALLTTTVATAMDFLLQPGAGWLHYFTWFLAFFFIARVLPLKGDSKPVDGLKPLAVLVIFAVIFALGVVC